MNINTDEYDLWNNKVVIADCLEKLGHRNLKIQIDTQSANKVIISAYRNLVQAKAIRIKNRDILDLLHFYGLINESLLVKE